MVNTKNDLTSQRFGKLVVIEQAPDKIEANGDHSTTWKCNCDCGRVVDVRAKNLLFGTATKCHIKGCAQNRYLKVGDKFGYVTITWKCYHNLLKTYFYGYVCDCGKKGFFCESYLRAKNKSCRCCGKSWKGISGRAFVAMRISAKERNIDFNITIQEIWDLFFKQKTRCALTGKKLKLARNHKISTASLDRIDSSKGYTIDNVQWVLKDVNMMKQDLSEHQFYNYCKDIYFNKKDKYEKN